MNIIKGLENEKRKGMGCRGMLSLFLFFLIQTFLFPFFFFKQHNNVLNERIYVLLVGGGGWYFMEMWHKDL